MYITIRDIVAMRRKDSNFFDAYGIGEFLNHYDDWKKYRADDVSESEFKKAAFYTCLDVGLQGSTSVAEKFVTNNRHYKGFLNIPVGDFTDGKWTPYTNDKPPSA